MSRIGGVPKSFNYDVPQAVIAETRDKLALEEMVRELNAELGTAEARVVELKARIAQVRDAHDADGRAVIRLTLERDDARAQRDEARAQKRPGAAPANHRCDAYGLSMPYFEGITFCRKAGARAAGELLNELKRERQQHHDDIAGLLAPLRYVALDRGFQLRGQESLQELVQTTIESFSKKLVDFHSPTDGGEVHAGAAPGAGIDREKPSAPETGAALASAQIPEQRGIGTPPADSGDVSTVCVVCGESPAGDPHDAPNKVWSPESQAWKPCPKCTPAKEPL